MISERRHLSLVSPESNGDDYDVIRFRPRRALASGTAGRRQPVHDRDPTISSVLSLAKYERDDQEDDHRHRMTMNVLALVVTIALVAAGVWLAAEL